MNCKYSETEKENLINRYLSGKPAIMVITENNIPRSTFYSWIKKHNESQGVKNEKIIDLNKFRFLENKVERLSGMIKILQTAACTATAPLQEKLSALELLYGDEQYRDKLDAETSF